MSRNATGRLARATRVAAALTAVAALVQLAAITPAYATINARYTCVDDNGGTLVPGDTLTCTLNLSSDGTGGGVHGRTGTYDGVYASLQAAPPGTTYVSGGQCNGCDRVVFRFPNDYLAPTNPLTASVRLKVKNGTPAGYRIAGSANYGSNSQERGGSGRVVSNTLTVR